MLGIIAGIAGGSSSSWLGLRLAGAVDGSSRRRGSRAKAKVSAASLAAAAVATAAGKLQLAYMHKPFSLSYTLHIYKLLPKTIPASSFFAAQAQWVVGLIIARREGNHTVTFK